MYGADNEDDDRDAEVAFSSEDSETSTDSSITSKSDDDQDVEQPVMKHRVTLDDGICPFALTSDGFVICTMCKVGIVPHPDSVSSQRAHLKKYHRLHTFSVQEFVAKPVSEIQALYDDLLTVRPPFQQFPVVEGYKCCVCGIVSSSVRKMRSHLTNNHGDVQTSVICHAEKVFMQVFECGNTCNNIFDVHLKQRPFKWLNAAAGLSFQKAFVVTIDDAVTVGAQSQLHHHISASQSQCWARASDNIHPTEAVACLFKWGKSVSELLPTLNGTLMAELVQGSAHPEEAWFGPLLNHCQAYLQKILKSCVNSCEESGQYLVLQMLRQESSDSGPPTRGFYCLQDDSLKSYSLTAVRLVAFLKRCQQDNMHHAIGPTFKDSMFCQM